MAATTHRITTGMARSCQATTQLKKPFVATRQAPKQRIVQNSALPDLVHSLHPVVAALDIDWSDTDVQLGAFGGFLGIALGIGAPIFYTYRDNLDEERLEELRALNRATKEETGEYLTPEEIAAIRTPRWTDRREFVDED